MFLTVHSTAGIALGSLTGNPILAFIMGLISHSIMDIIPHGDEILGKWAKGDKLVKVYTFIFITEFSIALLYVSLLFGDQILANPLPLLAGMTGAVLPDFISGFVIAFPNKFLNWIEKIHRANHALLNNPIPWQYGMSLQLLTLFLLIYQILN